MVKEVKLPKITSGIFFWALLYCCLKWMVIKTSFVFL